MFPYPISKTCPPYDFAKVAPLEKDSFHCIWCSLIASGKNTSWTINTHYNRDGVSRDIQWTPQPASLPTAVLRGLVPSSDRASRGWQRRMELFPKVSAGNERTDAPLSIHPAIHRHSTRAPAQTRNGPGEEMRGSHAVTSLPLIRRGICTNHEEDRFLFLQQLPPSWRFTLTSCYNRSKTWQYMMRGYLTQVSVTITTTPTEKLYLESFGTEPPAIGTLKGRLGGILVGLPSLRVGKRDPTLS